MQMRRVNSMKRCRRSVVIALILLMMTAFMPGMVFAEEEEALAPAESAMEQQDEAAAEAETVPDAGAGQMELVRYLPARTYYYYDGIGTVETDDAGGSYLRYTYAAPQAGDQLVIRDPEGTETTYVCSSDDAAGGSRWTAEDGSVLPDGAVRITDDQAQHHWEAGEDYGFTVHVELDGASLEQTVPVLYGAGVVTLAYEQAEQKVYYQGIDWNESTGEPYFDDEKALREGDTLTVTYPDRTEQYVVRYDENGDPFFENTATGQAASKDCWHTESDQGPGNYWGIGSHQVSLVFLGSTAQLKVEVRQNPVKTFLFAFNGHDRFYVDEVPVEPYDDQGSTFYFYNYYDRSGDGSFYVDGDRVTLVWYDDPEKDDVYLYDSSRNGFFNESGEELPFPLRYGEFLKQHEEPWGTGVNYEWFRCAGYELRVPVAILRRENPRDSMVERVAGNDRYATSRAIASRLREEMGVDKFDTVILASGDNFPDALCGSYLAYKKSAPILITSRNGNAYLGVNRYIKNNLREGGTVYVLGGKAAMPDMLVSDLEATGFRIECLDGRDRYETNLRILKEAGVTNEDILISSGAGFADSLSASAVRRPILLVGPSLTEGQKAFLQEHAGNTVFILGGKIAVGSNIERFVRDLSGRNPERIAGETRYETSIKIARRFFDQPECAALAYAWLYPDGLCGGPLAATMNCPLILTYKTGVADNGPNVQDAADYIYNFDTVGNDIYRGIAFGGPASMPDNILKFLFQPQHPLSDRLILCRTWE